MLWEQQGGLSGALRAEVGSCPEEEPWLCFSLVCSCLGPKPQLLRISLLLPPW